MADSGRAFDGVHHSMHSSEPCTMRTADVKGLATVLQALKSGSKQQVCSLNMAADGLTLRWEDESKTLQCAVFLASELFDSYHCPPGTRYALGLQLDSLLNTLSIFASAPSSSGLRITYPGSQGELLCEMEDGVEGDVGPCVVTYARLGAVEQRPSRDLTDFWEGPASWFLLKGGVMREAVEDLEWPQGDVEVLLGAQPSRLLLSSAGTAGKLQVEVPTSEMLGFHVEGPGQQDQQQHAGGELQGTGSGPVEVYHSYKYKAMRAAFCSLQHGAKDAAQVSSKVSIDANGMLKVLHMVKLQASVQQFGAMVHLQDPSTQRLGDSSAIVTFVTVPVVVPD